MSPNQENFEKLEAYIDGALDAAGQVEVQRLLAGNPQLRTMVAELMHGRELLMALPRASAPADVMETFQGHLERSALLGDAGAERADVVLRINRWPQIMSIAAILLLAMGLAAIVYQILPKQHSGVAVMNPAKTGGPGSAMPNVAGADGVATAGKNGGGGGDGAVEKHVGEKGLVVDHGAGLMERSAKPGGGGEPNSFAISSPNNPLAVIVPISAPSGTLMSKKGGELVSGGVVDGRPQVSAEELLKMQQQVAEADGPVLFMIQAKEPEKADEDVADFLTKNDITFVSVPEGLNRLEAVSANTMALNNDVLQNQVYAGPARQEAGGYEARGQTAARMRNGDTRNEVANNLPGNAAGNSANSGANYGTTNNTANLGQVNDQKRAAERFGGVGQGGGQGGGLGASQLAQQVPSAATRPALPDSILSNGSAAGGIGGVAGGNYINSTNSYGVTGTYRAMLTNRQLSELNVRIAQRGNQWAEVRGEPRSEVRSDVYAAHNEANIIAANGPGMAKALDKILKN